MARIKNAITKYEIKPIEHDTIQDYLELAKWIRVVTDSSEEDVEGVGYYDGDGTPEDVVKSRKVKYDFEGDYDDEDKAMKYVRSIENEVGEKRKVDFKVTYTDGRVETGIATISNIVTKGGDATDFEPFKCTISRDRKPEVSDKGVGGV